MAIIGTFGSFTAARLGVYASQASLNVTGHNIANINTNGFTRQRMDLRSIYGGGVDRYASQYSVNIGYGVLTESVSQLRDPFIDIRYRTEQAGLGQNEYKLKGLEVLASKLDEVGDGKGEFGVIERQFNDLLQQLQNLSEKTGSQEYDTLVRGSAETLAGLFRDYAEKLEEARANQEKELNDNVKQVNTILTNIRSLNEAIRNANICGDKALELRDERNLEIDKLSKLMKINVTYDMERIDQYTEVERLNIHLADNQGADVAELVRGIFVGQVSMPEKIPELNPDYDPANPATGKYIDATGAGTNNVEDARLVDNTTYQMQIDTLKNRWDRVFTDEKTGKTSTDFSIPDNVMVGGLQAMRELLTEEGEFASKTDLVMDPKADVKRGIPYYQQSLDALARKFAQIMNEANQFSMDQLGAAYETDPATGKFLTGDPLTAFTITVKRDDPTQPDLIVKGVNQDGKLVDENDAVIDDTTLSYDEKQQILTALSKQGVLTDKYRDGEGNPTYKGGPLFTIGDPGDSTEGILASNIAVSHAWSNRQTQIMNTLRPNEKVIAPPTTAQYESGPVLWVQNPNAAPTDTQSLTIGGFTVIAGKNESREDVLNNFVTLYNNNANNTEWSASLNKDGDGIVFTAKQAGSLETTGFTPPPGTDMKTEGLDEREVTITHTTANDNIDHMIAQMGKKFDYNSNELGGDAVPSDYFNGTFQEYFTNMSHILATDYETTSIELANHEIQSLKEENNRQSVSGVDLNDEATNMMQFQKSYQAACKLLTTLDSMLDTLINRTI